MKKNCIYTLLISLLICFNAFSQSSSDEVVFVSIPGGTFKMGCTGQCGGSGTKAEIPVHDVTVDPFEIAQTEVTNAQYCKFLNDASYGEEIPTMEADGWKRQLFSEDAQIAYLNGKWQPKEGYAQYPMVYVSWYGAYKFCEFYGYRLPYEAEWEFAARGGEPHAYSGHSNIDEVGWHRGNSNDLVHPVAQLAPTQYGTYDMSGNVWEWCWDWFDENYYDLKIKDNPKGPESGDGKANRGGSFDYPELSSRVSQRNYDMIQGTDFRLGFRPVK